MEIVQRREKQFRILHHKIPPAKRHVVNKKRKTKEIPGTDAISTYNDWSQNQSDKNKIKKKSAGESGPVDSKMA